MQVDLILEDVKERCQRVDPGFFSGKTIVVTGASGLIGTYLCAYFASLVQTGARNKIIAITHSDVQEHVKAIFTLGGVENLRIDLTDFDQYHELPRADIIVHAAGYAQPSIFMTTPSETLTVNVSATLMLLQKLNENGHFLYLSSSEIYCGSSGGLCREETCGTTTPYHPRAAYIEGKRGGETACAAYRSRGVRAISARLGDIYGPGTRKHDQRALNSFIEQGILSNKISLRDRGMAMRSYCYVADAVDSLLRVLTKGQKPVYNVGAPIYTSIAELAERISALTDAEVIFPEVDNAISGAPVALNLDLSAITEEFNKSDYLCLEEGLRRTIAWQRALYLGSDGNVG